MKKVAKVSIWKEEEDDIIRELVQSYGMKEWERITEELKKRGFKKKTGKQCRERWHNILNPQIDKDEWTKEQDEIMFEKHQEFGNKWTILAKFLPGRNENRIKNHFYSAIRRSFRRLNKWIGEKNSTARLRKIKPSVISNLFALAEGRTLQDDFLTEIQYSAKDLEQNCQEIYNYLMHFAQNDSFKNTKGLECEDKSKVRKVFDEMLRVNAQYEQFKKKDDLQKKQRKLEKNFDKVAAQEEDSFSQENHSQESISPKDVNFGDDQIVMTKSQRKIRKPSRFIPQQKHIQNYAPKRGERVEYYEQDISQGKENEEGIIDLVQLIQVTNTLPKESNMHHHTQQDHQETPEFYLGEDCVFNLDELSLPLNMTESPHLVSPMRAYVPDLSSIEWKRQYTGEGMSQEVEQMKRKIQNNLNMKNDLL